MVERVDNFKIQGRPFDLEVAAVFNVDDNGRITRWRDYYDLKSLEEAHCRNCSTKLTVSQNDGTVAG
jgi:limonene-1,2-epoxide hydrolase